ncbi:MAG: glycosyltransferase [Prevotellaceae bacterium]|nr:glycosyltransferase [Prevotellaceae bacterium]
MISVCIATYNGEKYLKKQLLSILPQLGEGDEVVISDDGSTDNTLPMLMSLGDRRIRLLKHQRLCNDAKYYKTNRTVAANFENALRNCCGDYIFLSDQDDVWHPDKVRVMMEFFSTHTNALCISARTEIDAAGEVTKPLVKLNNYPFLIGLITLNYLGSSMAFDRAFLNQALPFPKDTVTHDGWISMLAKWQKRLFVIDEPLHLYRRHTKNVTNKTVRVPAWEKIAYRMNLLASIMRRVSQKKGVNNKKIDNSC